MSPRSILPHFIEPMQPARSRPFHRPGWIHEEEVGGWRIVTFKEEERVV